MGTASAQGSLFSSSVMFDRHTNNNSSMSLYLATLSTGISPSSSGYLVSFSSKKALSFAFSECSSAALFFKYFIKGFNDKDVLTGTSVEIFSLILNAIVCIKNPRYTATKLCHNCNCARMTLCFAALKSETHRKVRVPAFFRITHNQLEHCHLCGREKQTATNAVVPGIGIVILFPNTPDVIKAGQS
jgi:hypothetical protein